MEQKNIMETDTVSLDEKNSCVSVIDQTKLPSKIEVISLRTAEEIYDAIYHLKVRGAPAIGVTAAFGMYILAKGIEKNDFPSFFEEYHALSKYLNSSRPTAVNLSWALKRMENVLTAHKMLSRKEWISLLKKEAISIWEEDIDVCQKIGEYGLSLIKKGDGILTHCNAGKLATVRYGTATAPIYLGHKKGYDLKVFCDETRPLLQGARLTAFELHAAGIDTTLICDNMSARVMANGWIDAIFVGCDRVAANGDTANKIGTSVVAAVAKQYNIPLYVCAPTSTIDWNTKTGADIIIEERNSAEVTDMWYEKPMAPAGVKVYNPAFDVTDHSLIAGIVTEYGIARAPYDISLQKIFEEKERDLSEK